MRSSIRLGRIAGIEVGLHYSWFVVLALVTWSVGDGVLPDRYPGWSPGVYWATGALAAVLLFVSVLVHELAHSLVARARGFDVGEITLFILGGVSNLKADSGRASDEFAIAIVGPVTSFALSALLWGVAWVLKGGASPLDATVWYLALINLLLGVFNLLPAFPLDGGRVLRSIIWAFSGNHTRATRVATLAGQAAGVGLMVLGVFQFINGDAIGGVWFAFLGWFLQSAARRSQADETVEERIRGVRVRDIMESSPPTIDPNITVAEAVFDHFLREGARFLLVCDREMLLGIVSPSDVRRLPRERWDEVSVRRVMTPMPLRVIAPDTELGAALDRLGEHSVHQLPVMEADRLVGILSRSHVIRYLHSLRDLGMR